MPATLQHHPVGITWHETNAMARAAHAVRDGQRVWLIDPFEDDAALEAAAARLPLVGEEAAQEIEVLVVDRLRSDAGVLARAGPIGAAATALVV